MELSQFLNILLMLGAVISVLLSLYLLFYPSKLFANKVLGILAFSWSTTVFVFMVQSPDFFLKHPHLFATLDFLTLLFFPLMYVYVRTYLYSDVRTLKKVIIHIIPALMFLLSISPFLLLKSEEKIDLLTNGIPVWLKNVQASFNLVIIVQGIFYTILSFRKLHHFEFFRSRRLTLLEIDSVKWLRRFVLINVVLWGVGTLGALFEILEVVSPFDLFGLFYFGLTILTIALGFFTIARPEFFCEEEDVVKAITKSRTLIGDEGLMKEEKEIESILNFINSEKPYLNPEFKLQDMAEATGISSKRVSELLNSKLKKSFAEIVNDYRLKEALRLLQEGFHKKHTMPYLAEKAGFNSKTTFNRIFKKFTGKTPTDYIQSI